MQNVMTLEAPGPLERLPETEIKHLLRGFSGASISGALALRTGSSIADFEACLFGILLFYRPPGMEPPEGDPSGDTRLHENLGLDSLSMSEAMFKIEELFNISIDNAELAEVATIADARRLLMEKLEPPSPIVPSE
jgi:acyl carrier protein